MKSHYVHTYDSSFLIISSFFDMTSYTKLRLLFIHKSVVAIFICLTLILWFIHVHTFLPFYWICFISYSSRHISMLVYNESSWLCRSLSCSTFKPTLLLLKLFIKHCQSFRSRSVVMAPSTVGFWGFGPRLVWRQLSESWWIGAITAGGNRWRAR